MDIDKVRQKFIDNVEPILGTEQAIAAVNSICGAGGIHWRWAVGLFSKLGSGKGN